MEQTLPVILTSNAVVDGFEMVYPASDADFRQTLISAFLNHIATDQSMSLDEVRKCVKIHILSPHIHRSIPAVKFSVWGHAAASLHSFDMLWADKITELHLKTYLVEKPGANMVNFRRLVTESKYGLNSYKFASKESNRSKKSSGEPGLGFGSKKSNKHAVLYRRKYQHYGYEVRIQGATLLRHALRAKEQADILENGDRSFFWASLCTMAGLDAYSYFVKDLRNKGAELQGVFSHAQARPWLDDPRDGSEYHRDALPECQTLMGTVGYDGPEANEAINQLAFELGDN